MKITPFDAAEYLGAIEDQVDIISDALELGDPAYIAYAIGAIVRAQEISDPARESGVTREALYRALSTESDPKLSTLIRVLSALGIKLTASAA